jgi:hypothetical protein
LGYPYLVDSCNVAFHIGHMVELFEALRTSVWFLSCVSSMMSCEVASLTKKFPATLKGASYESIHSLCLLVRLEE